MESAEVPSSLFVQVKDFASILVELLTRFGEGNPSGPTVEQRDAKLFFEDGDSLTDGCLSNAQGGSSGREAPLLRSPHER